MPAQATAGEPHDPVPAIVGRCTLTLTLSNATTVAPLTSNVTWNVNATGSCTDNHSSSFAGSITGSVTSVTTTMAGCVGGVYDGDLVVNVSATLGSVDTDAIIAFGGAALVLAGTGPLQFVGGGPFANMTLTLLTALSVPVPLTVAADVHQCVTTAGDGTMTWTGVYAFARRDL